MSFAHSALRAQFCGEGLDRNRMVLMLTTPHVAGTSSADTVRFKPEC